MKEDQQQAPRVVVWESRVNHIEANEVLLQWELRRALEEDYKLFKEFNPFAYV